MVVLWKVSLSRGGSLLRHEFGYILVARVTVAFVTIAEFLEPFSRVVLKYA